MKGERVELDDKYRINTSRERGELCLQTCFGKRHRKISVRAKDERIGLSFGIEMKILIGLKKKRKRREIEILSPRRVKFNFGRKKGYS